MAYISRHQLKIDLAKLFSNMLVNGSAISGIIITTFIVSNVYALAALIEALFFK